MWDSSGNRSRRSVQSKFLCETEIVDEGVFLKKCMKGSGALVKFCLQKKGNRHAKLLTLNVSGV